MRVLISGIHYWEVKVVTLVGGFLIGIVRPWVDGSYKSRQDLSGSSHYATKESTDGWFMHGSGTLFGNGMEADHPIDDGDINEGDRVGMRLDLSEGSLVFFRNGVRHGPGYPPGTVIGGTGGVVRAVLMHGKGMCLALAPSFPPD
jgi:hypothetical protein